MAHFRGALSMLTLGGILAAPAFEIQIAFDIMFSPANSRLSDAGPGRNSG